MPIYVYRCSVCRDQREVFQKIGAGPPGCEMCLVPMEKRPAVASLAGVTWLNDGTKGRYVKQADRHFRNAKELDAWAASRNLAVVSNSSREWRAVKDANKEEAHKDAQKQGFRDQEDRSRSLKENSRDHLAAAGQKKIDAYHEEHGTAERVAVDDFVKLPEKKPAVSVAG